MCLRCSLFLWSFGGRALDSFFAVHCLSTVSVLRQITPWRPPVVGYCHTPKSNALKRFTLSQRTTESMSAVRFQYSLRSKFSSGRPIDLTGQIRPWSTMATLAEPVPEARGAN